jgi:tetratricopeptide (TPR) repeat protein
MWRGGSRRGGTRVAAAAAAELAHALGVSTATVPTTAAVARLLGVLRERDRWLLVFDNAEDPGALARSLPGGGGHVVITSRNPGWHEPATPVEHVAGLLDRAATYLQNWAQNSLARQLFARALGLRRSQLGDDHPDTVDSAHHLALCLWALGHYEQASQLIEDTLTRSRRTLGDDRLHTRDSAHNLAAVLTDLGEHDQADRLDERLRFPLRRVG